MSHKHRAFFTRRSTAPREALMFGDRGRFPPSLWGVLGLLPGFTMRPLRKTPRNLTTEDYLG